MVYVKCAALIHIHFYEFCEVALALKALTGKNFLFPHEYVKSLR